MRCPDILVFCLSSLVSGLQPAPESVKLLETPGTSGAWRVDTRSEIAGSLKLPGANGQGKVLAVRGTSASRRSRAAQRRGSQLIARATDRRGDAPRRCLASNCSTPPART